MFIPLMKADAAQRRVYGSIDETLDRAGEILDYATAKPAFEAWSKHFVDATGGKSLGNIRAQHDLKKAAGKLVELDFDDDARRISFCAEIVDAQEWEKVVAGVYTGFSPGGSYAKRWPDGMHKRYTPKVGELSIVDMPCIPSGTFTMVKADGVEEEIEFVLAKAYEPGNEATKARSEELAKAAGGDALAKNFVVQARADLIAENATEALAKMAEAVEAPAEPEAAPDPAAALADSLAKADIALAVPVDLDASPFADLTKVASALKLLSADPLTKSLWSADWLNRLLCEFAALQSEVTWDAKYGDPGNEADMSIPAQAAKIVKAIGDLLITMTQEGVADILAGIEANGVEIVIIDGDDMALANQIVDLVKADTALMEKAGARNSKADGEKIQSMHDNSVALGATCDTSAEKAVHLAAENERLAKAVGDATPRIDALVARVGTLTEELTLLKAQPMPPKGAILAISKEADNDLEKTAIVEDESHLPLVEQARRAAQRYA
jgi:hypothetical protein